MTTTFAVSIQSLHRYCGFVHVKALDDAHCTPIEVWLQERFDHVWTSRETADSGPHVQFYVEGQEWAKADTNKFQKNGVLYKYLPEKMAKAKAKRWSKQIAKKDRDANIAYVAKGGMLQVCTDGTPDEWVGRWKPKTGKQKQETFHTKLLRLWEENGRPDDHRAIYKMLAKSRCIPWNNCSGEFLWKAADWLLSQMNNAEFEERMDREYEKIVERKYR